MSLVDPQSQPSSQHDDISGFEQIEYTRMYRTQLYLTTRFWVLSEGTLLFLWRWSLHDLKRFVTTWAPSMSRNFGENLCGITEPSLPWGAYIPYTSLYPFYHFSQSFFVILQGRTWELRSSTCIHLWSEHPLFSLHPHIFSDASHKSMRLFMHSAAMPEALFYAHGTAHGVK